MWNFSVKILGIVPRIESIKGTFLSMQTCVSVPEQMDELKRNEIYIEKCNFS